MATFKETELLNRTCQAIADLKPDPMTGRVTADQVKLTLGEMLDVWPESIANDKHARR